MDWEERVSNCFTQKSCLFISQTSQGLQYNCFSTLGGDQTQQRSRRRRSTKPPVVTSTPTVDSTTDTASQIPSKRSNAYRYIKLTNGDILKNQVRC